MFRRRELFGMLGASAAGVIMARRAQADDKPGQHDPSHAAMAKECEEACGHCEATCNTAFHHCMMQAAAGKAAHAKMAQSVVDCAAFCDLSAEMIARGSSLMVFSCQACSEACRHCAQECESDAADEMMKLCVASCRRCEASCRKMVQAISSEHRPSSDRPEAHRSSPG
jgi:hypothetical protein